MKWLETEAMGWKIFFLICATMALNVAYQLTLWATIQYFDIGVFETIPKSEPTIQILTWYFPFVILFLALNEELIFRLAPTWFSIEKLGVSNRSVLLISFVSAILFALAHGHYLMIFIHGVASVLYSLLYLKCGGFQGHYGKALAVTTITHALYNGVVAIIILSNGGTKL